MKTVRAGVVGAGHLGYHHARLYHALDGVDLVGVVDIDPERGERVTASFGAPHFSAIRGLLALGVDAVSVAVPTRAHRDTALELLDAGVDVLVEKPIADTLEHAREIVEAAAKASRIVQPGHIERFNGAIRALRKAIGKPRFIECHRLSPFTQRGDDVSVVHDLMIHDLDIAMALDGGAVVSVDAIGVPVFSAHEDIANARIRFASGCVANLTASRVSVERMRKIRVFEENAYASTDYSEQEVLLYRKKAGPLEPGADPMEAITIESLPVERAEPLRLELEHFIDCVRYRKRPEVSGEEGLAALEVAQRITDFIREAG